MASDRTESPNFTEVFSRLEESFLKEDRLSMISILREIGMDEAVRKIEARGEQQTPSQMGSSIRQLSLLYGFMSLQKCLSEKNKTALPELVDRLNHFLCFDLLPCRETKGKHFLHLAVEAGDPAICAWFIEKGADVNVINMAGLTPLYYANSLHDVL